MVALRSFSLLTEQPSAVKFPTASIHRSVSPDDFRQVFRGYAAGVVVVTAGAGDGPAGFTATSLSTLSLEPPLISFSIANNLSAWPTIRRAGSLTINFLDAKQHATAARFATSGIVRRADVRRPHAPLVYHAGSFGGVIPTTPEVSAQ